MNIRNIIMTFDLSFGKDIVHNNTMQNIFRFICHKYIKNIKTY